MACDAEKPAPETVNDGACWLRAALDDVSVGTTVATTWAGVVV